jgi:hypothetical protein
MLQSVLLVKGSIVKYFEIYLPKKDKNEYLYKQDTLSVEEWELLPIIA